MIKKKKKLFTSRLAFVYICYSHIIKYQYRYWANPIPILVGPYSVVLTVSLLPH